MKKDIQNRADIQKLVTLFHERLLKDETFKHLFLEVAKVDMLDHFETVIDFWESTLFQKGKYKGKLVEAHLDLNQKYSYGLNESHFRQWLEQFNATVDEHFEGEHAEAAKSKALTLATIIRIKIDHLDQMRMELNN